MSEPKQETCPDCGGVHGPPGMLQAIFGPNVTFIPLFTVQAKAREHRGPLTATEAARRWAEEFKRPHCRACRRKATLNRFLDYVNCPKCERQLNTKDVFWQSPPGGAAGP